jgi:hypothetical protein
MRLHYMDKQEKKDVGTNIRFISIAALVVIAIGQSFIVYDRLLDGDFAFDTIGPFGVALTFAGLLLFIPAIRERRSVSAISHS